MVEKIKQQLRSKLDQDYVILALEERGYCVSLLKNGKTTKKESRNANDFLELIDSSVVSWVDFVVDNFKTESIDVAKALGFSEVLVRSLLKNKQGGYEDLTTEMGVLLPAIIVSGFNVRLDPLLILIKQNLVVTIHSTEAKRFFRLRRYGEIFMRKIETKVPQQDKVTQILIRILDENNSRNFDHLREIEENSDKLSRKLADPRTSREILGPEIYNMKHALITYLGGLWATVDVLNTLRYGDPEVLTDNPKLLERIGALVTEVNNHIGVAEHLSEVLASGLEVLQSIYNNQLQILNNRLAILVAYLTIIGTAVLVPNTLATVLSNPAYGMGPADAGWYSALLVISTVVAIIVAYGWVKKTGWLPSRPE
ncbi:MAG: CorA family divalent cation transporter [Candidatus Bilamarchaeaceae archaeon]